MRSCRNDLSNLESQIHLGWKYLQDHAAQLLLQHCQVSAKMSPDATSTRELHFCERGRQSHLFPTEKNMEQSDCAGSQTSHGESEHEGPQGQLWFNGLGQQRDAKQFPAPPRGAAQDLHRVRLHPQTQSIQRTTQKMTFLGSSHQRRGYEGSPPAAANPLWPCALGCNMGCDQG